MTSYPADILGTVAIPSTNTIIAEKRVELQPFATNFSTTAVLEVTRPKGNFPTAVAYAGYRALVNILNASKELRSIRVQLDMTQENNTKYEYLVVMSFLDARWRCSFRIRVIFTARDFISTYKQIAFFPLSPPTQELYGVNNGETTGVPVLRVTYAPAAFGGRVSLTATFSLIGNIIDFWRVDLKAFLDPSILSEIGSSLTPQLSLPGWGEESCPRLRIYYTTDLWGGNEVAQVLMQEVGQGMVSQYLGKFGDYVVSLVAEPCPSFISKVLQIVDRDYPVEDTGRVIEGIATYGLLRYFLWYLITERWELAILRQSFTPLFQAALLGSRYACWNVYLQQPALQEFAKYFIQ